jgi:TolB protein
VDNGVISYMGRPGFVYFIDQSGIRAREPLVVDGLQHGVSWSPDGHQIAFERELDVPTLGTTIVLREWAIFVAAADGSGAHMVGCRGPFTAEGQCSDFSPVWSPDGTEIAFQRQDAIWVMGADGSNPRPLTHPTGSPSDLAPTWSPEGTRIAFIRQVFGGYELRVVGSDGLGLRTLVSCQTVHCRGSGPLSPQWSLDGRSILFALDLGISSVPLSGGPVTRLLDCFKTFDLPLGPSCAQAFNPVWSPDGTTIGFLAQDGPHSINVYAMNTSGSNIRQLTHDGRGKCCLAWQPLPRENATGSLPTITGLSTEDAATVLSAFGLSWRIAGTEPSKTQL